MKTKLLLISAIAALLFFCGKNQTSFTVANGKYEMREEYTDFTLTAKVKMAEGASGAVAFHTDASGKGYEVLLHNGPINGTRKTGSLSSVRNLYKSMASDNEWFDLGITVTGKSIIVTVNGTTVVSYTEPYEPYRSEKNSDMLLGSGRIVFKSADGKIEFNDVIVESPSEDIKSKILTEIDEQNDRIIRLQQENFPVIDYHVHLKGWRKEAAHARSMNYGINYSIAPNCGIGFTITSDAQVVEFVESMRNMPFILGMQGEGREWPQTFSKESRELFDFVFTDALTFTDHKGRRTRLWLDNEVFIDIPQEEYMDIIVDRIVQVVSTEPIDVYVNPFFLPSLMVDRYDQFWTKERIDRVVKALKDNGIALEINAYYRIPNFETIRAAMDAGVKLTFGTNNVDSNIGKLEYCIEAMDACGITADHIWFPSMRRAR